MKERTIEQYLVARVSKLRGEVRKVKWIGRKSAPDRLVMLPVQHFLVELKAPGKDATPAQKREHTRLRKFGWRVEVVNSFARVDEVLG